MRYFVVLIPLLFYSHICQAETVEVNMLTRGASGTMVFEPDDLQIQPGDTVVFKSTQKSHNAASINAMWPEGAKPFQSKLNQDYTITLDKAGFYGIKCTPHYAMGMVMLIQVGDAQLPQKYREMRHPGLANKRFQNIFTRVDHRQENALKP